MNRDQMVALLEDGAHYDWNQQKFFHPSFRKGWRKVTRSNISWNAVDRAHGHWGTKRLVNDGSWVFRLMPQ